MHGKTQTLTAEGVHFAYGELPVLQGVDMVVEPGSMTCLVGPNGSGKSTLLKIMAGAIQPQGGGVRYGADQLKSLAPRERATKLGWLPQTTMEAFGFTVAETIGLGLEPEKSGLALPDESDLKKIDRILAQMGLADLAHRQLNALSGGERQRALLAAVLISQPPVLLLDEPTAALDPHHGVAILEHLVPLAHADRAVLLVTHDLNLASLFADRIFLLAEGRIVARGTPEEVFTPAQLQETYGTGLSITHHPDTGRPMVLPSPLPGTGGCP